MNKFILLSLACLHLFPFSKVSAQVTAGVKGNLSVNFSIPSETVNMVPIFLPGQPWGPEAYDSLDLNRDGQYDVLFHCSSCNSVDCIGGTTSASPMHSNVEFMLDGDNFIRQLNMGDAIDENQTWGWADISILTHRVYGVGGYTELGNWFPQEDGYAGIRIISGQDTLYGWVKIQAGANPNGGAFVQVNLWAIEESTISNQPPDFIIAGSTSDLVPGNQTVVLEQGPIPFGGGDGETTELDLNQDGINDVTFNVTICNTFDCVSSSTLVLAMHGGFRFVSGQLYAKRLDSGDTIFSNANWNLSANSDLASQGLGFNGFQSAGEWLNDNEGYLGFRLITPNSDTLLGWIHIYTYSLAENGAYLEILGWAIQHDPSQKPYVEVAKTPEKPVYCKGDYVMFEANAIGAEQITWNFWDGTSDTGTTVIKILPDSTVTATFEATNPNGTTSLPQTMTVSPLALTVPPVTLDCAHPTATLTAATNISADICWIVGADTICNPTPPVINFPIPVTVVAEDEYGCIANEQVPIILDADAPEVSIEFDEGNHLLIAHSATPGVTYAWVSMGWPVANDSVFITQSGTYTVVVTAPNGCTAMASIDVIITSADEPFAGNVLIQPNPASHFLQIENRLASDFFLKIFDTAGCLKLASETVLANSLLRLDIEFLPAGLYLLAGLNFEGKPVFFRKFVKQ